MSSVRIAQESARGTFILLVGNVLSTAILTVATIFIARLLGPDGYGLYTLAFVLPGLLIQFVGLGVNVAITRYIAVHLSRGEVERARSVTRTATVFLFMFGVALSAVNFVVAPAFVMAFMHRPELVSYVQLASLWVLGVALTQCVQSTFVGWVSMAEASGFSVLLAVLKLVLSVGLIVAGFGVYGAVVSHVAAYLVDGVVGVAALYALKLRGSKGEAGF
ncbi:MAG TPA: oligosaccharide flippase family protein, partial [Nitrososphaerales archaeon]|nr:oligosaccharide flippase family protein [Nitrososphaerales archaeon]